MRDVNLALLVTVGKVLGKESLGLIYFKVDALKLFELLGIRAVSSHRACLLADGEDSLELELKVLPQCVTMVLRDKEFVLV